MYNQELSSKCDEKIENRIINCKLTFNVSLIASKITLQESDSRLCVVTLVFIFQFVLILKLTQLDKPLTKMSFVSKIRK